MGDTFGEARMEAEGDFLSVSDDDMAVLGGEKTAAEVVAAGGGAFHEKLPAGVRNDVVYEIPRAPWMPGGFDVNAGEAIAEHEPERAVEDASGADPASAGESQADEQELSGLDGLEEKLRAAFEVGDGGDLDVSPEARSLASAVAGEFGGDNAKALLKLAQEVATLRGENSAALARASAYRQASEDLLPVFDEKAVAERVAREAREYVENEYGDYLDEDKMAGLIKRETESRMKAERERVEGLRSQWSKKFEGQVENSEKAFEARERAAEQALHARLQPFEARTKGNPMLGLYSATAFQRYPSGHNGLSDSELFGKIEAALHEDTARLLESPSARSSAALVAAAAKLVRGVDQARKAVLSEWLRAEGGGAAPAPASPSAARRLGGQPFIPPLKNDNGAANGSGGGEKASRLGLAVADFMAD